LIRPISAVQLPDHGQLGPLELQLQHEDCDSILAADAEVAAVSAGAALEAPAGAAATASSAQQQQPAGAGPCWLPVPASLQPAALARLARASSPALGGVTASSRVSLSTALAGASLGSAPGSRMSSARASSSSRVGSSGRPLSPAARARSHTSCGSYTPVVVTELDQAIPSCSRPSAGQLPAGLQRASMPCNLGPSCPPSTTSSALPWQQQQQQPSTRATSPCLGAWSKQAPAAAAPGDLGPASVDRGSQSLQAPLPHLRQRASVSRITSPEPKLPASIRLAAVAAPLPEQPGDAAAGTGGSGSDTPTEAQPKSIAAARCPSPGPSKVKGAAGGQQAAASNGSKQHLGFKQLSQLLQWSRTY
jgi:hypothetical protein